ncbi:hypothetical protein [Hymenobacter sp. CRA2]|uniref:hypothetical protein n=1 Tax=Hymenobacter sp. CRA2 TaxID=1955620 RepID=UPI00098FA21B|nr:hypothetical protein [Hymenobacter sp. CRA2]OON67705.1 hypothetical protein B0919_16010 [Hymenobacter sp. CRA2]
MRPALFFVGWLSLLLTGSSVWAQPAADTATTAHQRGFIAAARAAGFSSMPRINFFYEYRADITQVEQLRRAGLDLRAMEKTLQIDGPEPYQAGVLYTDAVVLGTVVSAQPDARREVCYHSGFRVRVEETWQGPPRPADTIMVRQASGPMGESRVIVGQEELLQVGQRVILYLHLIDGPALRRAQAAGMWPYTTNFAPDDYRVLSAYPVADGYARMHYDSPLPYHEARRQIQRLIAILDKDHFYQKDFGAAARRR